MLPQQFIAKWQRANLSDRSASQQHFLDLCDLLGQPKPATADPDGAWYTFERGVTKTGGGEGYSGVGMLSGLMRLWGKRDLLGDLRKLTSGEMYAGPFDFPL